MDIHRVFKQSFNEALIFYSLTLKDLQELDNVENTEFSLFLDESNREINAERHSVALAEWVNDRKLVFESVPLDFVRLSFVFRW